MHDSKREGGGTDFIRAIVNEDAAAGTYGGRVATRFPPEPNGYLHIGHAKSICLNFAIAREFGGTCNLRFDDTNPETEDMKYVEAIQADVRWLGFDWEDRCYFASDCFEQLYDFAEQLILAGKAYVDSSTETEIRTYRGTVTEAGRPGPYRERSIEENLDLFRRMRQGEFENGAHVLRAKIDLAAPNMIMRDPILYRIRHASHYRTGDTWCIYPLYDFTHCLSDAIEEITHSLCTLEFKDNREIYDWLVTEVGFPEPPHQFEFARLNLDYTVLSKRKLIALVEGGHVTGWDDPRMPTIAGFRRRGVTPESIRAFCDMIGVAKVDSRVDVAKLEYAIRDDLNLQVPRVLAVLRPLKVIITNYAEGQTEELEAPLFPRDVPKEGTRTLPFGRELYIEREDFAEDPPKGFFRLAPDREVRLRYAYFVTCTSVVKDPATGDVIEVHCTYDPETKGGNAPDGRKVKGTVHWVEASQAVRAEVRLYDRLFRVPDPDDAPEGEDFTTHLNLDSLTVLADALVEPSIADDPPGSRYQFERQGYFVSDTEDSAPGRLVFNRTVPLRDTWSKRAAPDRDTRKVPEIDGPSLERTPGHAADPSTEIVLTAKQEERRADYVDRHGLATALATRLVLETDLGDLFDQTAPLVDDAPAAANWIVNDVLREAKGTAVGDLPYGGRELATLLELVAGGTISGAAAKDVLGVLSREGGDPAAIVAARGLEQVSDADALEPVVHRVMEDAPDKVTAYRGGQTGLLGYFVGQVMRETGGKANPKVVSELLKRVLG